VEVVVVWLHAPLPMVPLLSCSRCRKCCCSFFFFLCV
jgi:hypothetical protein